MSSLLHPMGQPVLGMPGKSTRGITVATVSAGGTLGIFRYFVLEGHDSGGYQAVPSVVLFDEGYPSGWEVIFKA